MWHPLAVAAGIGLIALLLGAAVSHRTHGDSAKDVAVPLVVAGLVGAYLALLF